MVCYGVAHTDYGSLAAVLRTQQTAATGLGHVSRGTCPMLTLVSDRVTVFPTPYSVDG